ncbi:expressed unknown protein [Seminavis robusta]|uniref:Exostosin GT47 domain-containing protein n=1 Tax=Seminavis robusta TaxID=568900 RepID=A0A9N8HBW6_9STRA|nr:expressed unknown protein [Seminavis robusta]|eukprot:Sro198_g084140.1 n/a (562) ;mRNA; f:61912-63830
MVKRQTLRSTKAQDGGRKNPCGVHSLGVVVWMAVATFVCISLLKESASVSGSVSRVNRSVDLEFLTFSATSLVATSASATDTQPPQAVVRVDPKPFRFYVYEQFADNEWSPRNLSDCILRKNPKTGNCDWALTTCVDDGTAGSRYASRRKNFNGDVLLADLFLRYPIGEGSAPAVTSFATRTQDPQQADAFIVAYAHDGHCNCHSVDSKCPKTPQMAQEIDEVFKTLHHYNTNHNKNRHLFLSSKDSPFSHIKIRDVPMRTTLGDLRKRSCLATSNSSGGNHLCPDIVIPYLNTHPFYQPHAIQTRPKEWWTTRTRTIAVAAIFGRVWDPSFRNYVLDNIEPVIRRHSGDSTIGGLPVQIGSLQGKERNIDKEQATFELYQNSIFCLILPGDGPAQKRFFDVIMSGCIPVVFVSQRRQNLDPSVAKAYPSWWSGMDNSIPARQSIRTSYPFPKGFFLDQPSLGIDYSSFVVQITHDTTPGRSCDFSCGHKVNATCQLDCLVPELERIMDTPEELVRLRRNLQEAAVLLNYGMEDHAFETFDAFAVLLAQLGHILERLPPMH